MIVGAMLLQMSTWTAYLLYNRAKSKFPNEPPYTLQIHFVMRIIEE